MNTMILIFVLIFFSLNTSVFGEDTDYLKYDIPVEAKKVGPLYWQDHKTFNFVYTLANQETDERDTIAIDVYKDSRLAERKLFKNGLLHGIQRVWHFNGVHHKESPYKKGDMHGTFRVWDDAGLLVGEYEMRKGTGRKRVYNSVGYLTEDKPQDGNVGEGVCFSRERNSNILSFHHEKQGKIEGIAYSFYPTDHLHGIMYFSHDRVTDGPDLEFSEIGEVTWKQWFLDGREVLEGIYEIMTRLDPSLPPYFSDVHHYIDLMSDDDKAALKEFLLQPRVAIPLKLDKDGNPLLAH